MVDATIKTQPRTIRLKGVGQRFERPAGATIKPGSLVALSDANKFVVHPSANEKASAMFAVENELIGLGIDDNYVVNDLVQVEHFSPGDWCLAILPANAAAVEVGDYLESNGDGTLRVSGADYQGEVGSIAQAMEAIDNSAVAAIARIMVAII